MKQIYSVLTAMAVLLTNVLSAQTGTISTTNPNPNPPFEFPLNVKASNGFTTTNQDSLGVYPKGKTTELTSPFYFYTADQPTIYFKYNFTIANSKTTSTTPIITIKSGVQSFSFTSPVVVNIATGTSDLYFSITPGTLFPANTTFQIKLTLDVDMSDKAITANSLTTNAKLFGGNASLPLPVKLVSFQGALNKNKVDLTWLVADNQTAKTFEVQRSTNGTDFTTAAIIPASQKSGDENYSFTENTSSSRVLYRLKMYDVDSKAEYSKTLVFNPRSTVARSLQVLTNPVKEKLVISFTGESNEMAQVNIYDNVGRVMQRQTLTASQGINTNTIALNGNYRSGLYIVELVTKSGKLAEKVIYSNQ